jgi:hypothetical protein
MLTLIYSYMNAIATIRGFPRQRGALSLGLKRPGREADGSPPSNAEVKEYVELYLTSPNTSSWRGAQLSTYLSFVRDSTFRKVCIRIFYLSY